MPFPQPVPAPAARYLPHLDGLRGLAALTVLVAHFNPAPLLLPSGSGLGYLSWFFQRFALGNLAVVFFFALSSFLLTYLACQEGEATGRLDIGRFILRRILRIWPLYFSVVAAVYLIYSRYSGLPPEFSASADLWLWLRNHVGLFAAFVSNWSLAFHSIGGHMDPSPGPLRILWSIGVEEQFYLVYPFLFLLAFRFPRSRPWLVALVIAGSIGFRCWFAALPVSDANLQSAGGMYYATLSYGDILLAGAVAGWMAARGTPVAIGRWLAWRGMGLLLAVASLAVGGLWAAHVWHPYTRLSPLLYPLVGIVFASFLLWSCGHAPAWFRRFFSSSPWRTLGSLSYGVYMWHVISNFCVAMALRVYFPDSWLFGSGWVRLFCSIAGALVFAAVSRALIERPFLHLKSRFSRFAVASGTTPLDSTRAVAVRHPAAAFFSASRAWGLVLAVYVILFGTLLWRTDGYPYVLDNNESYSSLWHARNLYENGVSRTKGLTEEVFAHHAGASPYIHSHQGNFPRLFNYVLYVAGLRTIGLQIWITTFTVGLAAIYLGFRFLSRIGHPLYAALVCLALMTDYLFFTQWQATLYNIWHGFFFFSSLTCVQALGDTSRRGRWLLLAILNFAALFYWEYVFTAFVTLLCGLYALVLYRRRFRLVLWVAAAIAAGAGVAAGTLLLQLTAYMGWANTMEDVRLTLTARNVAADPALLERVTSFYREHRIIFWHNFLDAAPLRSVKALWNSAYDFHLQYYTRELVVGVTLVLLGWLMGRTTRAGGLQPASTQSGGLRGPMRCLALAVTLGASTWTGLAITTPTPSRVAGMAVIALGAGLALGRCWTGRWWGWARLGWTRLVRAAVYAAVAATLLRQSAGWTDPTLPEAVGWLGRAAGWLLQAGGAVLGLSCVVLGNHHMLGRERAPRVGPLGVFLLCGVLAYAVTYRLFTGYIYSGYLHRQVPLLVFLTSLLLGLALYVALRPALAPRRAIAARLPQRLAGGFALLLVLRWLQLQATWIEAAPPDSYKFLSLFDRAPFHGRSFVSTTYPAPMAARSGAWGYADPSQFSGLVRLTDRGFETDRDLKYLWFADRDTNPAYLKPDYAVTIIQTPNIAVAVQLGRERANAAPGTLPLAESLGLVQRAQPLAQAFLQNRLVYSDGQHVSIVRLDWDYPPFLRPDLDGFLPQVRSLPLRDKLVLSESTQLLRRRWRVALTPTSDTADQIVLESATIDDRPLFSSQQMLAAGWEPMSDARHGTRSAWRQADRSAPPLAAVIEGGLIDLNFQSHRAGGKIRVELNDRAEELDLRAPARESRRYTFSSAVPHGRHTYVPAFAPGLAVQTKLEPDGRTAEVAYHYAHQEGAPEAGSIVRLYHQGPAGWELVDAITFLSPRGIPVRVPEFRRQNPDTVQEYDRIVAGGESRTYEQWLADHLERHPEEWSRDGIVRESFPPFATPPVAAGPTTRRVPLPPRTDGTWQFSVTPATRTKAGPEYFGLSFTSDEVPGPVAFRPPAGAAEAPLTFGRVRLRLRFPPNRWPQSDPIVSTGSREAGDFLYVHYVDANHVRFGYDHWFRGGPISDIIPVDFTREHELEISFGSLFPAREDVVFANTPAEALAGIKDRVYVKLNGEVVLDGPALCYEASPDSVTVGLNQVHGTMCGPRFTGEILSWERFWPESP